jgi:hypothetical protein
MIIPAGEDEKEIDAAPSQASGRARKRTLTIGCRHRAELASSARKCLPEGEPRLRLRRDALPVGLDRQFLFWFYMNKNLCDLRQYPANFVFDLV